MMERRGDTLQTFAEINTGGWRKTGGEQIRGAGAEGGGWGGWKVRVDGEMTTGTRSGTVVLKKGLLTANEKVLGRGQSPERAGSTCTG